MSNSYRITFDDGTDKIMCIKSTDTVVLDDEYDGHLRTDRRSLPAPSPIVLHERINSKASS